MNDPYRLDARGCRARPADSGRDILQPQSSQSRMADPGSAEVRASQRPSMHPLPQVYQPALQSAERGASSAPPHSMAAGEKGELAEYFGVSWTPEISSRSPGGRIRRAVGRFSTANGSPMRYAPVRCLPPPPPPP